MHRIDTPHAKTIDGKPMFFNGDPTGPRMEDATELDAGWLNAVQEELCRLVEHRKGALEKGNYSALVEAVGKPLTSMEESMRELKAEIQKIKERIG